MVEITAGDEPSLKGKWSASIDTLCPSCGCKNRGIKVSLGPDEAFREVEVDCKYCDTTFKVKATRHVD